MELKQHANGTYYVRYATSRGPREQSLKTKNKAEARARMRDGKFAELEHLAVANALTQEAITRAVTGRRVTGLAALTIWKQWAEAVGLQPNTRRQYEIQIGAFLRDTGLDKKPVSSLDETKGNAWINQPGVSLSARTGRIKALRNFCVVLSGKGLVSGQPGLLLRVKMHDLTHTQKETVEREPYTEDEVRTLVRELPTEWAAAVALARHTGFRLGDVAKLEWGCFTKRGGVAVWMDKTDQRIELPLPAEAKRLIEKLPKADDRFVFPEFAKMATDVDKRAYLSTYFKRAAAKAGVEGKSFHCLRHTFATEHRRHGASIEEIRSKLGHALADTTATYVHVE